MNKLMIVKNIVAALALATLATSSAFAKNHHSGSSLGPAAGADPYTVIVDGMVVGRDPDPNIRFDLMREAGLLGD
jgi:hypothetical protein